MTKNGVFWLREDFRVKRNDALTYATLNHENVSVVYIFKKKEFTPKTHCLKVLFALDEKLAT